jgi:amino acid permease
MSTTLVLDLAVGLLANMAFGKQTHESITAEFIEENIGHPEYVIGINVALALSVLLTYPLQFRPACEVVEAALGVAIEEDDDAENGLLLQDGVKQRSWWQTWG